MENLLGAPVKPVKFTDVHPGSTIRITDNSGGQDPYEALVLEVKPEYGSNRIPALVVNPAGTEETTIVAASGRFVVTVLLDSKVLAAANPPTHLVTYLARPVQITGVQFKGGIDSATEIIRWAGGKAAISWRQADATRPEALVIRTLEGDMDASVGDTVVEGLAHEFYPIKPAILAAKYEVVE